MSTLNFVYICQSAGLCFGEGRDITKMNSLEKEHYLIQIRDKLRKDDVKLWLPPYTIDSTKFSEDHLKVIKKFQLMNPTKNNFFFRNYRRVIPNI